LVCAGGRLWLGNAGWHRVGGGNFALWATDTQKGLPIIYREDALKRIRRLERDINDRAKRMNEIIRQGNLPEEPIPEPYPEDDEPECE